MDGQHRGALAPCGVTEAGCSAVRDGPDQLREGDATAEQRHRQQVVVLALLNVYPEIF